MRLRGELVQRLHRHDKAVSEHERRAGLATEHAIGAELSRTQGRRVAVAFVVGWIVAGIAAIPETWWSTLVALLLFALPVVYAGVTFRGAERRLRAEHGRAEGPGELEVACESCGGRNQLVPGAPVVACRFCDGALMADEAGMAQLVDRAAAHE